MMGDWRWALGKSRLRAQSSCDCGDRARAGHELRDREHLGNLFGVQVFLSAHLAKTWPLPLPVLTDPVCGRGRKAHQDQALHSQFPTGMPLGGCWLLFPVPQLLQQRCSSLVVQEDPCPVPDW